MANQLIYFDDELVKVGKKQLEGLRPGVLKAKGVFETILIENGHVYAWDDHMRRMKKGLKAQQIDTELDQDSFKKKIRELLRRNRLRSARVRLSVWAKNNKNYVAIVATKLSEAKKGYAVCVSSVAHPQAAFNRYKTLNYKKFYKASQYAAQRGYDEALLLDNKKYVVEGARTNIFILKANNLLTPPLSSHCLDGTARSYVFKAARKVGLRCVESKLRLQDVFKADAVLLTNALIGIAFVHRLGAVTFTQRSIVLLEKLDKEYRKSTPKIRL